MPLQVRPTAIMVAVLFFFVIALVDWFSGLDTFTCCKRAVTGAVLSYVAVALAIRLINVILLNALIDNQVNKRKQEINSGNRD